MKHLILIILFVLSMAACAPLKVDVDNVKVVHQVDLANVEKYFTAVCEANHPAYNTAQLEACSDAMIGEFLTTIVGGK